MSTLHQVTNPGAGRVVRAHEWEMVSAFALSLPEDRSALRECQLEPLVEALEPLGLDDELVCHISAAVEQAGESLRLSCEEGKLECVNVRVHVSTQGLRHPRPKPWDFFVIKQMASSESDNLTNDPCSYIDLHVYQNE